MCCSCFHFFSLVLIHSLRTWERPLACSLVRTPSFNAFDHFLYIYAVCHSSASHAVVFPMWRHSMCAVRASTRQYFLKIKFGFYCSVESAFHLFAHTRIYTRNTHSCHDKERSAGFWSQRLPFHRLSFITQTSLPFWYPFASECVFMHRMNKMKAMLIDAYPASVFFSGFKRLWLLNHIKYYNVTV